MSPVIRLFKVTNVSPLNSEVNSYSQLMSFVDVIDDL